MVEAVKLTLLNSGKFNEFSDNGVGFNVKFYIENHILNDFFEHTDVSMFETKQENQISSKSS